MKLKCAIGAGFVGILIWIICQNTRHREQIFEPSRIIALSPVYQLPSASKSNNGIFEILEYYHFDKVRIVDGTLQESIEFMRHKLNEHPEIFEINFIVRVSYILMLKKENITLENVSATDALKAISEKYGVSIYIMNQSIVIDN